MISLVLETAYIWHETNRAGVGVADETAITASVQARVGARVGAEVAVATCPDTASLPVVRDVERYALVCILLPTSGVVGDSRANVQVREDLDENSEQSRFDGDKGRI